MTDPTTLDKSGPERAGRWWRFDPPKSRDPFIESLVSMGATVVAVWRFVEDDDQEGQAGGFHHLPQAGAIAAPAPGREQRPQAPHFNVTRR